MAKAAVDEALVEAAFNRSGHGPRCWRAILTKAGGPVEEFVKAVEARVDAGQEMNANALAKILKENFNMKANSHSIRRHYSRQCACER